MDERMESVERDLKRYKYILKTASLRITEEGISQYPIFVAHKEEVKIGLPLVDRKKTGSSWSINVSMVEEFIQRKIILPEKLENFQNNYKNSKDNGCLFVIDKNGANFVFYSYQ